MSKATPERSKLHHLKKIIFRPQTPWQVNALQHLHFSQKLQPLCLNMDLSPSLHLGNLYMQVIKTICR